LSRQAHGGEFANFIVGSHTYIHMQERMHVLICTYLHMHTHTYTYVHHSTKLD